jgi:predicted dehydrogenase
VAENYFYKPLTRLLRSSIGRGDLGDVLFIQLNALKWQKTSGWRDDAALAGGGALFEGGIHWVSLLANIGLTPRRIRAAFPSGAGGARLRSHDPGTSFAEGAVGTLSYSWDLPALVNGMRVSRVYGTRGTMRFETNGVFATLAGRRKRLIFPGLVDLAGYRAMMADFIAAIEEGRPPAYNLTLARRDLHLIEEAYASISGSQHS